MAAAARDLENELRQIRQGCRTAFDTDTGKIDPHIVHEYALRLKAWILDFENSYMKEAIGRPTRTKTITDRGQNVAEHAWHMCEVLWVTEIDASGAPVAGVRWEAGYHPSGVVFAELKQQFLTEFDALVETYRAFRREYMRN